MKYIRIYVSKKDIEAGEINQPNECPIARAIKRVTKTKYPYVDGWTCYVKNRGKRMGFILPNAAKSFVSAFDSEAVVSPFSFRLTPKLRIR